jgi:hypothetical protein
VWGGGLLGVWALTVDCFDYCHCCCHFGCLLLAGGVLIDCFCLFFLFLLLLLPFGMSPATGKVLIVCLFCGGKQGEKHTHKKNTQKNNTCIPVGEADADVKGC